MIKAFLEVSEQIALLERRGLRCDERSERLLLREGYYAIINGYGKHFLDAAATQQAHDDRFAAGTSFADVHALFAFDRTLRMVTFSALSQVEGMLRSLVATSFLEQHAGPEDYLDPTSFTDADAYLLGAGSHARNLGHTLATLERYTQRTDEQGDVRVDARLAHYWEHYDSVPLWVVFSDFSYGNLFHFLALMKPDEQRAVCRGLASVLGNQTTRREPPTRRQLVDEVEAQVDMRNICAHGERLFDAHVGYRDAYDYAAFLGMMEGYLPASDVRALGRSVHELLCQLERRSELALGVVRRTGLHEAASQLEG